MAAFEKADGFLHWLAGIWSCRSVAGDEQKANERELEREREREREGERETQCLLRPLARGLTKFGGGVT